MWVRICAWSLVVSQPVFIVRIVLWLNGGLVHQWHVVCLVGGQRHRSMQVIPAIVGTGIPGWGTMNQLDQIITQSSVNLKIVEIYLRELRLSAIQGLASLYVSLQGFPSVQQLGQMRAIAQVRLC